MLTEEQQLFPGFQGAGTTWYCFSNNAFSPEQRAALEASEGVQSGIFGSRVPPGPLRPAPPASEHPSTTAPTKGPEENKGLGAFPLGGTGKNGGVLLAAAQEAGYRNNPEEQTRARARLNVPRATRPRTTSRGAAGPPRAQAARGRPHHRASPREQH